VIQVAERSTWRVASEGKDTGLVQQLE